MRSRDCVAVTIKDLESYIRQIGLSFLIWLQVHRVGADLLLVISDVLKENGMEMPFTQREVKILNP